MKSASWFAAGVLSAISVSSFIVNCNKTENLWHNQVKEIKCEPEIIYIDYCSDEDEEIDDDSSIQI